MHCETHCKRNCVFCTCNAFGLLSAAKKLRAASKLSSVNMIPRTTAYARCWAVCFGVLSIRENTENDGIICFAWYGAHIVSRRFA